MTTSGTLSGQVAVVTGGASGLGRASAARLIADGAAVTITDVDAVRGEATAAEIGAAFLVHDVTDEERWDEVMREVGTASGGVDILVNNAGMLGPSSGISPETTTYADWKRVMTVNADSVFLGCRAAIREMRRTGRGGSIVNIASVAGERSTPYATAYGASKSVVSHLTRSVAQHCIEEGLGIRCNSVHPGNVHTPLHDRRAAELAEAQGTTAAEILSGANKSPLGGWVPVEQIASAVAYLCGDDASYMTGTKFVVDGGLLVCDSLGSRATPPRR